ncbi:hypothetical protein ACU8OJ_14650 [Rhizobium leguminosarum]
MRFMAILSISLAIGLAGCSQVAEKAENAANRSYTSYALGKPYGRQSWPVANGAAFRLRRNLRADDRRDAIDERHDDLPAYGARRPDRDRHEFRRPGRQFHDFAEQPAFLFLVGADGIVKDWATGSVQGSASDCVQYIGGIINRCNDMRQLQASLALYDVRVATKAGQPISSWGEPAAPVVN